MWLKILKTGLFFGLVLLLVACGATSEEVPDLEFSATPEEGGAPQFVVTPDGYPVAVLAEPAIEGYPGPGSTVVGQSIDGRKQTAVAAYELALAVALDEFSPEAYLYTIAPSNIMLSNLGNPPVLPGWFYIFKKPESRREFIVQVVDSIITGTTLTESISDIQPAPLPIDINQVVLDSDEIFTLFPPANASDICFSTFSTKSALSLRDSPTSSCTASARSIRVKVLSVIVSPLFGWGDLRPSSKRESITSTCPAF